MNREDLKNLSKTRLKEAKILHKKGQYDGAAYLVGYVLETALKARICRILDADYPDSGDLAKVYKTHSFDQLIKLGGIRKRFDIKSLADFNFQNNYSKINGWQDSWRYETGKNKAFVDDLFKALEDKNNGILTWIKKLW
jgi:HEPN domain-containing protein